MNITDQFRVPAPIDEVWQVLLDVERIAPCLPGAELREIEGDEYRGVVNVKVGPITAQYKGAARIVDADERARRIVLQADGRDARGQGSASATITVTMAPDEDGTVIEIDTDLTVTGKVAQFGRGVMADVSTKLLERFASSLESDVLRGGPHEPAAVSQAVGGLAPRPAETAPVEEVRAGVRTIESRAADPIDLVATAGGAMAKRVVPVLIAVIVGLAFALWLLGKG